MSKLARFYALGFDLTANIKFTPTYKIKCSQCEACVINGIPTHETGCPNARHECDGCDELIPPGQTYCHDCQQS